MKTESRNTKERNAHSAKVRMRAGLVGCVHTGPHRSAHTTTSRRPLANTEVGENVPESKLSKKRESFLSHNSNYLV